MGSCVSCARAVLYQRGQRRKIALFTADHEQDWQPCRFMPSLVYAMTVHTLRQENIFCAVYTGIAGTRLLNYRR